VLDYHFQWSVIWRYEGALRDALATSLALAAASVAIGAAVGLLLAYACLLPNRALRTAARGYVDVVRNTPLLLLVFFLYLALPQLGVRLLDRNQSFVLALSLVASGYLAENFRAAIAAVPRAAIEGAKAIGLRSHQRQLYVVLPIALRYALPSLTNTAISVFKDTSVASVIAVHELTFVAREISTNYFRVFEAWASVCVVYLTVCGVLALGSRMVERRMPRLS
jgi:polar amino acid transport system permease protein